jgi:hypothetical protein
LKPGFNTTIDRSIHIRTYLKKQFGVGQGLVIGERTRSNPVEKRININGLPRRYAPRNDGGCPDDLANFILR